MNSYFAQKNVWILSYNKEILAVLSINQKTKDFRRTLYSSTERSGFPFHNEWNTKEPGKCMETQLFVDNITRWHNQKLTNKKFRSTSLHPNFYFL